MSIPVQAVFFRQRFPPPHDPLALSFFGGAPVAPATFRWPRSAPLLWSRATGVGAALHAAQGEDVLSTYSGGGLHRRGRRECFGNDDRG